MTVLNFRYKEPRFLYNDLSFFFFNPDLQYCSVSHFQIPYLNPDPGTQYFSQ